MRYVFLCLNPELLFTPSKETLDNVFDGISQLDIPALLSDIVPEESKNALKDIEREVAAIVAVTGAVLTEFQQHGSSTEEFHLHMQAFLEEIRVIAEAHFPPLDSAPGHEERQRMANEFIERIRGPFVSVAKKLGIPPDDADALWTKLSSPVAHVVVLLCTSNLIRIMRSVTCSHYFEYKSIFMSFIPISRMF